MHLQGTHSSIATVLVSSPSSSFRQLQQKSMEIQSVMKATPSQKQTNKYALKEILRKKSYIDIVID